MIDVTLKYGKAPVAANKPTEDEEVEDYGDHALAERTCQKWFARFRSGNFDLEDDERPGQPKKFEVEDL